MNALLAPSEGSPRPQTGGVSVCLAQDPAGAVPLSARVARSFLTKYLRLGAILWLAGGMWLRAEPAPGLRSFHERTWEMKDGLPDNTLNAILQTRDGYLWLGTEQGLARFDGVRFEVFDKWNTKELHSDQITALCEDPRGRLWIGTKGGGLARYEHGRLSHAGLSSQFISALCADRKGRLWVGTSGGGLFMLSDGNFVNCSTNGGLPDLFVLAMCEGRGGTLWIGTRYEGLFALRNDTFIRPPGPFRTHALTINAIFEDDTGGLWLGNPRGLLRLASDNVTEFTMRDGLPGERILALAGDSAGNVWVGTEAGAVRFSARGPMPVADPLTWAPTESVTVCAVDREGNAWLGTAGAGLKQLAPTKFASLSRRDGLSHDVVNCIYEDRQGGLWFGTPSGLDEFFGRRWRTYGPRDGLANPMVTSLLDDAHGTLWIGTAQGLNRLEGGTVHGCSKEEGWPQDAIRALHKDALGRLWIGSSEGLFQTDGRQFRRYSVESGLPSNDVRALAEDRQGRLWVGTSHGLARYAQDKLSLVSLPPGLLTRIILALYADSDGTLWCGTLGGGLVRWQDQHVTAFTVQEGLPDNTIFQILDDGLGQLWLTSNRGILRVSKAELNRYAEGRGGVPAPVVYDRADGLPSEQCNGFSQPAGWRTRDGRLWFPTAKGVAVIDPSHIATNPVPPPVVLERVVVDNEMRAPDKRLRLRQRPEKVEFHFSALSFALPERVRFRYRLEGFDRDWIEAGTRRVAYYTRPPAGQYRFRVTACNPDGVWNKTGAGLLFVIEPPFWASWWFYTCLAAVFGGAVLVVHALRVARLARAQAMQAVFSRQVLQQQEAERRRIAANLHDSLGQDLLIIKNQASLARSDGSLPPALKGRLDDIFHQAMAALKDVRQITHDLRPYQLDRLGLTLALRAIARKVAESSPIQLASRVDDLAGCLDSESEINLYRIVQEGLNNVVKHSGATEATLVVRKDRASLHVSIRDNGCGFDRGRLDAPSPNGEAGFGLAGVSERVKILGGSLTLRTQPSRGCSLEVEVPLRPSAP